MTTKAEENAIARAADVLRKRGVGKGETIPQPTRSEASLTFYQALVEEGDFASLRAALSEHSDAMVAAIFEAAIQCEYEELLDAVRDALITYAEPFVQQARDA